MSGLQCRQPWSSAGTCFSQTWGLATTPIAPAFAAPLGCPGDFFEMFGGSVTRDVAVLGSKGWHFG